MEVWGGIECTINRVADEYFNQLHYQGHYDRSNDPELIADLGIKKLRYPVLWEKHQSEASIIDWGVIADNLLFLKESNIDVIAGLVHHGSGPKYASLTDGTFEEGLSRYATQVASKFPWINHFTPVNEPLTTARFCGLYGLWYPHAANEKTFLRILVNECRATIKAMQAIRKVNPLAQLVHTEDLGKVYSSPRLQYQADFENERRWLGLDLICGSVNRNHFMFSHLIKNGIAKSELEFFIEHATIPDIMGFNHYITSERYLDDQTDYYPEHLHGGNGKCRYADVEAIRVAAVKPEGAKAVLREAWVRYQVPIAVTEAHLYCGREDQLRWLNNIWKIANELEKEGVDIRAVTVWSLFGAYGWDNLLTLPAGNYESGTFDVSSGSPRATALSKMVKHLALGDNYQHPVLNGKGWWENESRIIYPDRTHFKQTVTAKDSPPVLIVGASGTLGNAFMRACIVRDINYVAPMKNEVNLIYPEQIEAVIQKYKPWAILNAAGYVNVDAAELEYRDCFLSNTTGPGNLASCCARYGVKLVTFSSDLVFDGRKQAEYLEEDNVNPLNVYGLSKAAAEHEVLNKNRDALIIRTSSFFGPWDQYNFVFETLRSLQERRTLRIAEDVFISPTYVPDLVDRTIDLMIDDESGIWHLTNYGTVSWFDLAKEVTARAGFNPALLVPSTVADLGLQAERPLFSALKSSRGILMPTLDHALDSFFLHRKTS